MRHLVKVGCREAAQQMSEADLRNRATTEEDVPMAALDTGTRGCSSQAGRLMPSNGCHPLTGKPIPFH